ncbi:MAG TPA: diguanylate cyclase [Limnochordia bacterium]|nr:diguanylate cyclase [Limnochordia bacterium]
MDDLAFDAQTRLPNLFALLQDLRGPLARAAGYLMLFDIAEMSLINARYGPESGDATVRRLAEALADVAEGWRSPGATAYRGGGDQFFLALPDADSADISPTTARIRAAFRSIAAAAHPGFETLHCGSVRFLPEQSVGERLAACYQQVYQSRQGLQAAPPALVFPWVNEVVEQLADHVLQTVDLVRDMGALALTDEVSGLPNHRAAKGWLKDQQALFVQTGEPYAILFIDGDDLKEHNERFGYDAGNELVRNLGAELRRSLRPHDRLSRWLSGDEFLAVLPNTRTDEALAIAERLCTTIQGRSRAWRLPTSVSVGVASCPDDAQTAEALLHAAEHANLAAKRSGKARAQRAQG